MIEVNEGQRSNRPVKVSMVNLAISKDRVALFVALGLGEVVSHGGSDSNFVINGIGIFFSEIIRT
ncbi:MAG: hypothetical protein KDD43_07005 [Bdellovibrionales bacterium]|nr:hypothetical protein [Bdellovibrionales bacterium]